MKRNNIRLPKDLLFKILGSMYDAYADALPRAKKIFNCNFEKEFGDTPEAQLVTIGKYGVSLSKVESYLKKIKRISCHKG